MQSFDVPHIRFRPEKFRESRVSDQSRAPQVPTGPAPPVLLRRSQRHTGPSQRYGDPIIYN